MTTNVPSTMNAQLDWDKELRGAGMLVKSGLVPKDILRSLYSTDVVRL